MTTNTNPTSDPDIRYSLRGYTQRQKENWKDSKRIVLYDNDTQFRDFIRESQANKQYGKKMYFGAIASELAALIKLKTGIDVEGFNCSLSANEVRKIFKDHGDPNAEMLRGQRSVTEDDIVNIPIVIQSPSDISLSQKLYNGKPVINFVKNMDGKTTVSAVVSDKHLDLFVQTAFVGIKKGNLATPTGEQAPINTPEASNGTVSTLKVTQPDDGVKRSDRDPDAARVAEVLQKENTKLKEDVKYLKELLKLQKSVTGGKLLTRSSVEAAAGHLMKTTNARGEKAELVKELNSFYEYIAAGEFLTWDGVVENAQPAIKWLQDHMIQKKQVDEYSAGILREIRNSRFHLDDFQKKEVAYYYGSYNNFRKRAMGSFVTIPADYCSFLTQIGNGIIINISPRNRRYIFGIKRPVTKRINRRLKMPFIFEEPYHERLHTHEFELPEDCIDPESEEDNSCERCIHLDDCFFAYSDNLSDYDHVLFNGAYPICYAGCTYTYFLLVTGKHRGEVWINNETSDFAPTKKSFYEFLKWAATSDVI